MALFRGDFFPRQCRNAVKVAELSQLEKPSSPSVCHRQPARHFSYKYFQHFLEATYFGVVSTSLFSFPLCPPPPHPFFFLPMEDILWFQERSHRGLEPSMEFLQSWTTLWVFPGLDSIDKRLCSQPLGLHMCLFKCQWPTQAEYLLAAACLKSKAELQFIFIVQSTDPFIVVISVPSYLWNYSGSSEKLTSTLQCFFTARV